MFVRRLLLVIVGGLLALAGVLVPHRVAGDSAADVQCTGFFAGTAHNLVVPAGGFCIVNGATINHDVIVLQDGELGISDSTVGHDLIGRQAGTIEVGCCAGPAPDAVTVGHDVNITGADPLTNSAQDNGYDVCNTRVDHDLTIANTAPNFEIEVGDKGTPQEFCSASSSPPNRVGHDLVIVNNRAGRIDIGDNAIRHDLIVSDNTASTATGDSGDIDVSDNRAGHAATCTGNNPEPTLGGDGDGDGPNTAPKKQGCP